MSRYLISAEYAVICPQRRNLRFSRFQIWLHIQCVVIFRADTIYSPPTDDESFFLRACAETMERPRFLVSAMWLESTSGSNKPIPHLSDCFRSGLSDADTLHERPESGPLNSFRTGSDGFGSGIFPCPFHSLAAEDRRCVFRLTRSGSIFVISRGVNRYHGTMPDPNPSGKTIRHQ